MRSSGACVLPPCAHQGANKAVSPLTHLAAGAACACPRRRSQPEDATPPAPHTQSTNPSPNTAQTRHYRPRPTRPLYLHPAPCRPRPEDGHPRPPPSAKGRRPLPHDTTQTQPSQPLTSRALLRCASPRRSPPSLALAGPLRVRLVALKPRLGSCGRKARGAVGLLDSGSVEARHGS